MVSAPPAFFAEKQCVTILDFVVWPETMIKNRNQLEKPSAKDILDKLQKTQDISSSYKPFGDGNAAEKVVKALSIQANAKKEQSEM